MINVKKILFMLLIFSFAAVDTFGGGQNRAGTNAAPELMIPVGSRYISMGGANVADAIGLEAIYWNPAGVTLTSTNANAIFSYRKYIADMNMDFAAVSGSFGDFGTLALSFRALNIGQIQVTTMDQPDGTGELFSPSYFVLGLTYSKALTDRVSVGVTANLINESWANVSTSGFSFDIGVQYRNLFDIQNLALGVVVKNLGGSLTYGGNGLFVQANDLSASRGTTFYTIAAQSSELPSQIVLGLAYAYKFDEDNSVSVAGSFVNNNYSYDEYRGGAEYSYKNIIFLRGGYITSPNASPDTDPNIWQGFSFGVGLNFKNFTDMDISVDYAYIPVKYFDANSSFTVRFGF
jgi:hypothetical protein